MIPQARVTMFEDKTIPEPNSGCWLWLGSVNKQGYGNFWHAGKCWKAHRFSFTAYVGPIPDGMDLLHRCDVPSCVNPAHLTPGTALDNVRDMWAKRRGHPSLGQSNGRAKLTGDGAQRIRDMAGVGYEYSEIARRFRIDRTTVSRIVNRSAWRAA